MIGGRPSVLDDMAKYGTKYIIRDRLHVGYTDVNARCKDMVTVFRIHPDLQ